MYIYMCILCVYVYVCVYVCIYVCLSIKPLVTKFRITSNWMCALSVATPMSLQQLSRLALRRKLGTKALKVIGQLHIPKLIISYLCYQWASVQAGGPQDQRPGGGWGGTESWWSQRRGHSGRGASAGEKMEVMDTHGSVTSTVSRLTRLFTKQHFHLRKRVLEAKEAKIGKSCFSQSGVWIFTNQFIYAGKDLNLWF